MLSQYKLSKIIRILRDWVVHKGSRSKVSRTRRNPTLLGFVDSYFYVTLPGLLFHTSAERAQAQVSPSSIIARLEQSTGSSTSGNTWISGN